jgi:hypothetical protein
MFWDFKVALLMKMDHPYFRWYSCQLVHHLSYEGLSAMTQLGRTLNDEMEMLRKATGQKSYIAVVKLMPLDENGLIMQTHVFNLKHIEEWRCFVRQDNQGYGIKNNIYKNIDLS